MAKKLSGALSDILMGREATLMRGNFDRERQKKDQIYVWNAGWNAKRI